MIAAGIALAALPMVVAVVAMVRTIGWKATASVWGIVALALACVLAGTALISMGVES